MSWILLALIIIPLLAADLLFHKTQTYLQSLCWSVCWIALGLSFAIYINWHFGSIKTLEYITAYLLEKSLSIDNIFVFSIIFQSFRMPLDSQHKVLFWGIFGAIVMRIIMIVVGISLIEQLIYLIELFGIILLISGVKIFFSDNEAENYQNHWLLRILSKILPISDNMEKFIVWSPRIMVTPLLIILILVEFTDLIFALDSIPAIFGITLDPFIIISSNIFAILGLRSLYFLLAQSIDKFVYLKPTLAIILCFIGIKMLIHHIYPIPTEFSLGFIFSSLGIGIMLGSIFKSRRQ